MRILLANYRYFVSGGPERYMFEAKKAMETRGHEVIPFSVHYSRNEPTPYEKFFVSPLAGPDAVKFNEHRWTAASLFKTIARTFYSPEVERAVGRLIDDTRPDVAYILHYLKKLSPALLVGLRKRGVPIVVRLSDFLMLCPQSLFLRDGRPCTLCARGSLWPSIRYRCVKGSLAASVIHYLSWTYHRHRRFFDLVDRFVVPSEFMLEKMAEGGWPRERLVHIPTFAPPSFLASEGRPEKRKDPYIVFVGHFEAHKGVDLLLRAYGRVAGRLGAGTPRLILAAGLEGPLAGPCRRLARESGLEDRVEFKGFVAAGDLPALYRNALFTVVPSICYENMPNSVLESFACGTPVIGSGHGSIAPLIVDGETGFLFKPGDEEDLAQTLLKAMDARWCREAGEAARRLCAKRFSLDGHMTNLFALFAELLDRPVR